MAKNSISYGLLGGLLGGLGFLGYKIFNGEDADEETIENAKKSVSFSIDGKQSENEAVGESVTIEQEQEQENATDETNNTKETENIKETSNTEETSNSEETSNAEETKDIEEKIENIDSNDTVDLELEAQEVDIGTQSEPVIKNIFKRQDSSLDSSNVGRIVTV